MNDANSIYLLFTKRYLIDKDLFNVRFDVDKAPVDMGANLTGLISACAEEYKGERRSFLCIDIISNEENDTIHKLIKQTTPYSESEQASIKELADGRIPDFHDQADDLLRRFRWLTNLKFDPEQVGNYFPLRWSTNRSNWSNVPYEPEPDWRTISFLGDENTSVIDNELVRTLIGPNMHLSEPLAHDLIFEAKKLLYAENLRGAFTIGYSALEVGIKEFIRHKAPQTTWLLENSPSPDILKIISKYLPTLDKKLEIDGKVEKGAIKEYMEERNKLIHTGKLTLSFGSVAKKIHLVEYILHRLDYCTGLDRAELYAKRWRERVDVKNW